MVEGRFYEMLGPWSYGTGLDDLMMNSPMCFCKKLLEKTMLRCLGRASKGQKFTKDRKRMQ